MPLRLTALAVILGAAIFAGGYALGSSHWTRQGEGPLIASAAQVQDAVHRWALKARESEASVRQHWSPRAMFIPIRNQGSGNTCIELKLEAGAVGGSPVYCYRDQSTLLVAEYSDVE